MANFNIDYLVVAGGGGGARSAFTTAGAYGGGGGAGEFLYKTSQTITTGGSGYTVTVGDGGNAGISGVSATNGGNSVFIDTTLGGGYGGTSNNSTYSPGGSGGSGGGSGINGSTVYAGGSSTATSPGLGNAGGASTSTVSTSGAGGGGGAGTAGSNGTSSTGGNGGTGVQNSITSTATFYAGGGGGGSFNNNNVGSGGSGVGGNANARAAGSPGTSNTGSGGGGGSYSGSAHTNGASGGSGIVILRYATADVASYTATGLTPTQTTNGTDTILSFTTVGTGTITFTTPPPPPITPFDGTRATTPVTGFNKTGTSEGLKLPSGTNTNQPIGAFAEQGMIRNDTEETVDSSASAIAHYNGTAWQYFAATESPDVVYPTSLKMYLDASNAASYPGTGTTWFDLTSNSNNGIISGATFSPSNASFDFNGSSNYIDINNFVNSFFNNAVNKIFSVSIWFNPDQLPTSSSPFQLWQFGAWSNGTVRAFLFDNGKVNFQSTTGGSSYANQLYSSTSYSIGNWNNLVCVYDGTTKRLYLNDNSPNSAVHNYDIQNNTGSIGKDDSGTYYFNGKISKFNVYDKALTQAEITALYNEGR